MSGGYISLYNASSAFSDAEVASALPDLQSQVSFDFNWYWGLSAYLDVNGGGSPIVIVDYPGAGDPQGALGYHWVDANYQPYAVIFAGLCRDYGYPITGVISHELLEMLADQLVDTCVLYDFGDGTGIIILQEVCDPCEESLYYEAPNGNVVSDFALPGWYVPFYQYQVDFLGVLPGPWQLGSGGYVSYQYVSLSGWQQATGDKVQQDMAKAAEALRTQVGGGNPHLDVVRRLQMQGGQALQPRKLVLPGAQQQAQRGPDAAQRRQQPARAAGQITVVKRQDVPGVGLQEQMGQGSAPNGGQQAGAAKAPARGSGSRNRGGPKVQPVPEHHA